MTKFRWLVVSHTRIENIGSIHHPDIKHYEVVEPPVLQVLIESNEPGAYGEWETIETEYEIRSM